MIALFDTRHAYHTLSDVFTSIGLGVLVLLWVLIIGFAIRFRRRGPEPPPDIDENPKAEGAYVALLTAIAAMLVYFTFHWMANDVADLPVESPDRGKADTAAYHTPKPVERIRVTASRWNWRFDYQEGVTQVGTGTTIPTLVVPTGDVQLRLTSLDVIHSFFIPYLRFKRDAFPQRSTNFTLGFTPGEIGFHHAWGACAQFCGLRHAYMQFNVQVMPPAAFRRWLAARKSGRLPQQRTPMLNEKGTYS